MGLIKKYIRYIVTECENKDKTQTMEKNRKLSKIIFECTIVQSIRWGYKCFYMIIYSQ